MSRWRWIDPAILRIAHDEQLAEHGGAAGVRDEGLFESALARPQNLAAYQKPDAAALGATYAYGLARNHAFVDGNKRTALIALEYFLELNGWQLTASDVQCVQTILSIADGTLDEETLAAWVRAHIQPL